MRSLARSLLPICLRICALGASAGCAALDVEGVSFVTDAGDDPPQDAASGDDAGGSGQPDALPSVQITVPASGATVPAGVLRIQGTSDDDRGVASVFVKVGPNVALLAQSDDNFRTWWLESQVPQGMFFIEAEARDLAGQRSVPDRIAVLGPTSGSDEQSPTLQITSPPDGSAPLHALVLVRGTAADDRAVVSIDLLRNGELLKERAVETDDFFANWSRLVPLIPGVDNELVFIARDAAGHEAQASITLFGRAEVDRAPPQLAVTTPAQGATLANATVDVVGTAADDVGLREVKLRTGRLTGTSTTLVWEDYVVADTADGYTNWHKTLPLPIGAFTLEARAIDLNGLATSVTLALTNDFVPAWTDEVEIPLRLRGASAPPVLRFELDRAGIDEVFAADIQQDITVLELDTTDLLNNSVAQIKESCGTRWRENNEDPRHDCSLTPLGQSYGANWRASPEYSFVRLLTMTPANVVVAGTSIAALQDLADRFDIGGGFHEVLADTLGIPITREIVSTAAVVQSLKDNWLSTHPAVAAGARLPITLYDAMHDMAPLRDRFGPSGAHPGVLDPSFAPSARVFGEDFQTVLVASSNLRWLDGIDLSGDGARAQKDYIAVIADTLGPTFDDVLEFDFNDPAKFDVRGLVTNPRADLRMRVFENAAFVNSCVEGNPCRTNQPPTPYGNDYVWSKPKWELEYLLAGAARNDYAARSNYSKRYYLLGFVPAADVTVGVDSPAGWTTFDTLADLGDPPPAQYVWELILEVGQVALHQFGGTTLAEGDADVAFTLRDVGVGLSASEIRSAMRPELQEQRHTLSDKLLGNYAENNGAVDFYYRRGSDNMPYLTFVAASDPRPIQGYGYAQPGFFADEALTQKVSTLAAGSSGDPGHEKLPVTLGETTLYVRDDGGQVYRLRLVAAGDLSEIRVFAARKVQ